LRELEILNRLKNASPKDLNHDIFKVAKSSVELALKATIDDYGFDKSMCRKLKNEVNRICKELEGIWDNIKSKDIIEYESGLSGSASKWSEVFSIELKEFYNIFNDGKFDEKFQKHFHLYFGEYLKRNHAAYIAYDSEMQKMILNAINELKNELQNATSKLKNAINELKGENIIKLIKESIAQYIKDIPAAVANAEMYEEIAKEFQSIKAYFESKEIITITKIDKEVHFMGYPPIENNYEQIQKFLDGKYQFRYRNTVFYVDELNYLTGKIKVNHILIPNFMNAIKDICIQWDSTGIYRRIENNENQITGGSILRDAREFIKQNFLGIITPDINLLFAIEENRAEQSEQKQIKSYIDVCRTIIKTIVGLSVNVLLIHLLEENINIKDEDKPAIKKYFETESKSTKQQIVFAYRLMNILSLPAKDSSSLLQKLLNLKDYFSENGVLSVLWEEIDSLHDYSDVNRFDNYRSEKILTEFLEYFAFLANYSLISIHGMEYHNMKKCEPKYIQYYNLIDFSKSGKINHRTTDTTTFTHAVFLQNRADEKQHLNLFPFVIDRNALKNEKTSAIAFFNYQNTHRNPYLEYDILGYNKSDKDNTDYYKFERKKIDGDNKYSEDNIRKHNVNCVVEAFEKIKAILTE
jgi:hypothetical protein